MVKILQKEHIVPNIHEFIVTAPDIARKARAGQFVIVIPDKYAERIPITIADWDNEQGTISILFLEIGAGTQSLAALNTGDEIFSFTGPLGRSFEIKIRNCWFSWRLLWNRCDISFG